MAKAILMLIAFISASSAPLGNPGWPHPGRSQGQTQERALTPLERATKVTITTVGDYTSVPKSRYRIGDQIVVAITMTNTSTSPQYVCTSADLYQVLPKLTKDGQPVSYMNWQSYERLNAQRNNTCKDENIPEPVLLKPNEPTKADWFVLVDSRVSTGAAAWYDTLAPGKYELSIQRRLGCCDGPMVESNKISFEVVP